MPRIAGFWLFLYEGVAVYRKSKEIFVFDTLRHDFKKLIFRDFGWNLGGFWGVLAKC